MHLLLGYQTDNILKGLWFTALIIGLPTFTHNYCVHISSSLQNPHLPIQMLWLHYSVLSLQTPQSVHLNMLGLLRLSGSLPLFLCFRSSSFFFLATSLFSYYSISPSIFPFIFPSVQMFLSDLFMSDTVSECPVHFLWEHSVLIFLHLDAYFLPICSPTQLLQYIDFLLCPEFVCSDVIFFFL